MNERLEMTYFLGMTVDEAINRCGEMGLRAGFVAALEPRARMSAGGDVRGRDGLGEADADGGDMAWAAGPEGEYKVIRATRSDGEIVFTLGMFTTGSQVTSKREEDQGYDRKRGRVR